MMPKAYKYDRTIYQSQHEDKGLIIKIADYWTFYSTGTDSLILNNQEKFFYTKRYENERYDSIAFDFYRDENYSDTLLAFNKENYMTDIVMDYDMLDLVVQKRIQYIEKTLHKHFDEDEHQYYEDLLHKQLDEVNAAKRIFIAPKWADIESANRLLKNYFESRRLNENKD